MGTTASSQFLPHKVNFIVMRQKWKLSHPPFLSWITHLSLKTLTLETRLYCFNWGRGVNVIILQFLSFDFHVQVIKIYSIVLYLKKSTVSSWHVHLSNFFFWVGGIYPLIIKVFKKKSLSYKMLIFLLSVCRVWNWNSVWKSDHRICQESIIEEQSIYLCCLRICIVRGHGSLLFPFGSWYFVCFLGIVKDLTGRVW